MKILDFVKAGFGVCVGILLFFVALAVISLFLIVLIVIVASCV